MELRSISTQLRIRHRQTINFLLVFIATITTISWAETQSNIQGWITNSDQLTLPSFVESIITSYHNYAGWQLPRSPFIFPDMFEYIAIRLIGFGQQTAFHFAAAPGLMMWVLLGVLVSNRLSRGFHLRRILGAVGVMLYGPLLIIITSNALTNFIFIHYFSFSNHFSSVITTCISLYLALSYIQHKSYATLIFLALIVFFSAMSDLEYVSTFSSVFICMLLFEVRIHGIRNILTRYSFLIYIPTTSLLAGRIVDHFLNLQPNANLNSSSLNILHKLHLMFTDIWNLSKSDHVVFLFLVLVAGWWITSAGMVIRILFRGRAYLQNESENYGFFYIFLASTTFAAFTNLIFSAMAWENIGSSRYLVFCMLAPFCLMPAVSFHYLEKINFRTVQFGNYFLIFGTALCLLSFDFKPSTPLAYANEYAKDSTCVRSFNGQEGLANYWYARRIEFMTDKRIVLYQMTPWSTTPQNLLFYWGNNILDYLPSGSSRKINYLIANDLDSKTLNAAFGSPNRVFSCGNLTFWLYGDKDLRTLLLQGNIAPFMQELNVSDLVQIPGAIFHSQVGHVVNQELVISGGNSAHGFMAFGQYMNFKSGTYRFIAQMNQPYNSPRMASGLLEFQLSSDNGQLLLGTSRSLSSSNVLELTLKVAKNGTFIEPRIWYQGQSAISLKFIKIVRIAS